MYSFPSTSQIFAPSARSTKNGSPPTLRKARTGGLTPPGILFCAALNSLDEREPIESSKRRTLNPPSQATAWQAFNVQFSGIGCIRVAKLTPGTQALLSAPDGGVAKW